MKQVNIELKDTFDSIILEDEQIPLHFEKLDNKVVAQFCVAHIIILLIVLLAAFILLVFRKKQKIYIVELLAVALIAVVLCFKGNCSLDWIFAVAGTIFLEIINIIFGRKYSKEGAEL